MEFLLQPESEQNLYFDETTRGVHSIIVLEGQAILSIFDAARIITPGDLIILPTSVPYRLEKKNCRLLRSFASGDLMKKINQLPMVTTNPYYWKSNAGKLHQNLIHCEKSTVEKALSYYQEYKEASEEIRIAVMLEYLALISVTLKKQALIDFTMVSTPFALQVLDYIEQNLTEKITASQIAKVHFVSVSHLQRNFKTDTGLSLNTYLQLRRLEEAKKWLIYHKNVSRAWHQSGFSEYSGFFRAFKENFGVSPKEFCRQEQQFEKRTEMI